MKETHKKTIELATGEVEITYTTDQSWEGDPSVFRETRPVTEVEVIGSRIIQRCEDDDGKPFTTDVVMAFQDDVLLRQSLGLSRVPSAETLRNRLDLADSRFAVLTPCASGHIPLDIDVTPFDNSGSFKEGVSRTYKNVDANPRYGKLEGDTRVFHTGVT